MFSLAACGCAAAVSASALAQPLTGLYQWQVSADGGATWSSSITLGPGDPYQIRGVASWTDGATPSTGFAGVFFEQTDLIGADASDVFGGVSGPGTVPALTYLHGGIAGTSWSLYTGSGASAGGLAIDVTGTPGSRIQIGQVSPFGAGGIPYTAFQYENPILGFLMSAVAGQPKTLTISATWTRLGTPRANEFKIYTTPSGTNKKPVQEAVRTDAVVTIIPAPATALVLTLPSLIAVRRRRAH